MQRAITAFATDEVGDWVARLSCGHRQHVRHQPPLVERPWVLTQEGRAAKIGERLDCVHCDRSELPEAFVAYKRTAEFTEASVPDGLKRDHATKTGVWARIVVLEGRLRYCIEATGESSELDPEHVGIVVPEVRHHVEPIGAVRFFVEFRHAGEEADV